MSVLEDQLSLDALFTHGHVGIYEKMSTPLKEMAKQSVQRTALTNIVALPLLLISNQLLWSVFGGASGFLIWFTADVVYGLLNWWYFLTDYLVIANAVSLALVCLVLVLSKGMTRPVDQSVHWLAWVAAFPAGVTVIVVAIMASLLTAMVVTALILWVIIITFVVMMILGLLAGMLAS